MASKNKKEKKAETGIVELTSDFKTLANVKKSLTEAQLDFIRDTISPSLNDNEIALFLYRANIAKLDPLNGEMFAYAAEGKQGRQLVMFAGRDGKRVAAERTGLVEYIIVEPIYVSDKGRRCDFYKKSAVLVGAEAEGKRSDKTREYKVTVKLSEYSQDKFIWNNKPETMIKKVAESQLLSMMFPNQLGGIYDYDSENFTQDTKKEAPVLKDGTKPATAEQITTLQALTKGKEKDELPEKLQTKKPKLTKQEAADLINEVTAKTK